MKHISKILAVLLSLVLVLVAFASCEQLTDGSNSTTDVPKTDTKPGSETDTDKPNPTPTPSEAVEIGTAEDFLAAVAKINAKTDDYDKKTLKLTADIALTGEFTPISGFSGTLDGQFHKITGLDVATDGKAVGLFDTLDGATVKNLVLEDAKAANAAPDSAVGLLAGTAKNATIEAVTVSGTVTAGGKAVVGGLVGTAEATKILNVSVTVTLAGTGAKAGGVVGALLEKATVTAVYADATLNVGNAVSGAVVGTKVSDSAVAFALSKTGDAVGAVDGAAYLPSYAIACKTGLENKDAMGWNSADWDVSGEVPTLKADADKTHAEPKVTVDGKALSAVWGEKIAEGLSKPEDADNVATLGYKLGDEVYYDGLPVLGDLTLSKLTVDYSVIAGTHAPVDASASEMTVGQTLIIGEKVLTRVWAEAKAIGDFKTAVAYYADETGTVYSVSLEKCTLVGATDNAYVLTLTNLADNSTVPFAAPAGSLFGAWEKDGKILVLDGTLTEKDGKNLYRVLDIKAGTTEYFFPYYVIDGDKLTVGAAGVTLTDYTASTSYFDGVWVSTTQDKLTFEDGKVNGNAFTAAADADGAYLTYTDGNGAKVVIRATANGLTVKVGDGAVVGYANNRFSGVYVGVKDGKVLMLRIEGDRVYVNGSENARIGTLDFSTEVPTFTVTIDGTAYVFSKDGTQLVGADGAVYAAEADVKKFERTWILGSEKFVIANGVLTVGGETYPLTLAYADGAYSLTGGNMTFAFDANARLTVSGYESPVTGDSANRTLWTPADANVFLGGFKGTYVAINTSADDAWHIVSLTNGVLTVDGKPYAFEIALSGNTMMVKVYMGETGYAGRVIVTLRPDGDFLILGNAGLSLGYGAVPASLQDVVGKYYQFLTGTGNETEVKQISFALSAINKIGTLIVDGKEYVYGDYEIELVGGKVIFRFVDGEGNEQTVTFENKTAVWSGDADHIYTNYDQILPSDSKYVVVGKETDETLEVIKGNLAHDETYYDEDEEENVTEHFPASFPLYGFRYTVGGVTYTSTKFQWMRVGNDAVLIIDLANGDAKQTIMVTYNPASDESEIKLVKDGATVSAYTSEKLKKAVAGKYTNGKDSFALDSNGVFTLNGERVSYLPIFDFENGVYTFLVGANGKTYTLTEARREIAKVGDDVYYDSRVFNYAGVKLIAYTGNGVDRFQPEYTLELTADGWKFCGELIKWKTYENFLFEVVMGDKTVMWRGAGTVDSGAVNPFAISLYPNATLNSELGEDGWANRYFVPEILANNTGLYAGILGTGEMTDIFEIIAPVSKDNAFTSFTFTINGAEYIHSVYTFRMVNGSLNVIFDEGEKVITLTQGEGGTTLAINGVTAQTYIKPDMTEFATENQFAFGGTNSNLDYIMVTVDENGEATWYYAYGKGEYSQKSDKNFGYGQWNGQTIVFIQVNAYKSFVLVQLDGKVWVIYQEIFNLTLNPLTTPDGKTLTFEFKVVTGDDGVKSLALTGKIDGKEITDVEQRAANYDFTGTSHAYLKYTYDGVDYAIALNCDAATAKLYPAVILTLDEMNACYHENLTAGTIYFAPIYDAESGNGKVGMQVKRYTSDTIEVVSYAVTADSTIYKLVYTISGTTYTDYIKFFSGAAMEKGMKVIKSGLYPAFGDFKVGDETVKTTFELDESGVPQYYFTIGDEKHLAAVTYGKDELYAEVGEYKYLVSVTDGSASATKVKTKEARYVGEHRMVGSGSYDAKVTVAFVGGAYVVKYNGETASVVTFATDASYLAFTVPSGSYRIYWTSDTSYYYKTVVITEAQAAFIGFDTSKKLEVALTQTSDYYLATLTVKYDGASVGNVKYHSDTLMSFEVGDKVYVAEVTADGVKVTANVLDLSSPENAVYNAYKGSFTTDKKNQLVIDYIVTVSDGVYDAKFVVTLDGKNATLTLDNEKGIVDITVDGTVKHYVVYVSGSSKVFIEVSASDYAKLGSKIIGDHKLTVKAEVKTSTSRVWDEDEGEYVRVTVYSLNFVYYVDDVKTSSTAKTFGDLKFTQLQQSTGDKKVFYYYVNGETVVLQEMTADEVTIANMSSKTVKVGDVTYTLKGNVTFADGKFTVGYVFGTGSDFKAVTLTAVDGVDGASSFTVDGATYYYLISGSYKYLVTASDYAVYGEKTYGDVTLKFTWGTYQLMVAMKGEDGTFGTAVKVELLNDGTKDYKKFTFKDGKTYILATDKDSNEVLTDITNLVNLKHIENFLYQSYSKPSVYDLQGNVVFATIETGYVIGDDGVPVFVFKLDNKIVTVYSEMSNGEVLKMTIDGVDRYFAIATDWPPSDSWYNRGYTLIEVTEAQAAFFGKAVMVDGKGAFIVLGSKKKVAVFVGASVDESWKNTADNVTFNDDGSLTFSYGGVNYKATVTNGVLTVTNTSAS